MCFFSVSASSQQLRGALCNSFPNYIAINSFILYTHIYSTFASVSCIDTRPGIFIICQRKKGMESLDATMNTE